MQVGHITPSPKFNLKITICYSHQLLPTDAWTKIWAVHLRLPENGVATGQVFPQVLHFSPVNYQPNNVIRSHLLCGASKTGPSCGLCGHSTKDLTLTITYDKRF